MGFFVLSESKFAVWGSLDSYITQYVHEERLRIKEEIEIGLPVESRVVRASRPRHLGLLGTIRFRNSAGD